MSWCDPRAARACPTGLPELSHALVNPASELGAQFDQILNLSGIFGPLLPLDAALRFWAPLDYTLNDLRGALPTFTRDSAALWRRDDGQYFLVPSNTARFQQLKLLMEPAATNLFVDPESPATQSINLPLGDHTLSVIGSGSVTSSNDGGTATGHGTASEGSPITITVTVAGTILFTVSGAPTYVQVEAGLAATSPIITGSRAADNLDYNNALQFFSNAQGMLLITWQPYFKNPDALGAGINGVVTVNPSVASQMYLQTSGAVIGLKAFDGVNARTLNLAAHQPYDVMKLALRWTATGAEMQLGYQRNGEPWVWSATQTYAGAWTSGGAVTDIMSLMDNIEASSAIGNLQVWNEDRGISWIEQNY